jgi:Zn-dependent M28 family amino/carboxypeptidase
MVKQRLLATAGAAIAGLALAGSAHAATQTDTSALRGAVNAPGVNEHQAALEVIANENIFNGIPTRATGTDGHWASVDYVEDVMTTAGWSVVKQPFTADIFYEEGPAAFERTGPPPPEVYTRYDGETGVWYPADFSGDGDVDERAVVIDFTEPTAQASASDSGCEPEDFGPDTAGAVVLLQRGTCDFGQKAEFAQEAGAVGAVIFNEGTLGADDRNDVLIPTLAGYEVDIPVVGTDYATGRALVDRVTDGEAVTIRVAVDGVKLPGQDTVNVVADLPGGRADRTVVVGGHLDSVFEGPGINDDGSGVSLMMEMAQVMKEKGLSPRNHLRFIFFSGEEQGLLGSDHYVSELTRKEATSISAMLDYDMLGSNNFARLVYDGDGSDHGVAGPNGSGQIEQVFREYFNGQDLYFETIPFDGRSDYDAFTGAGIPAGGIFAGAEDKKTEAQAAPDKFGGAAGVAFDPYYHQLGDTLAHVNNTGLEQLGDAAVHAIWTFAQTTSAVNGTGKASSTSTKESDWKGDRLVR